MSTRGTGRRRRLDEPGCSGAAIAPAPKVTPQALRSSSAAVASPEIAAPSASVTANAVLFMSAPNAGARALFRGPVPSARSLDAREQLGQPNLQRGRDLAERSD